MRRSVRDYDAYLVRAGGATGALDDEGTRARVQHFAACVLPLGCLAFIWLLRRAGGYSRRLQTSKGGSRFVMWVTYVTMRVVRHLPKPIFLLIQFSLAA